ncbi:hypothetical protein GGX14DRAFT_636808 [Mycena pura]|uniref:Uncharacterized protein n=1 Tax=Mycena pura TaxID=153505 RepID=A0AAD6VCF6_9AGAR|nr:hypothetical protein GGX14DRAFT_636808 [Mycena pura]
MPVPPCDKRSTRFCPLTFHAHLSTVALTGYETITVFKSDYNAIQTFWFHAYIPSLNKEPGTLCDSRVFNLGDSFTTNYSLFPYSVASVVSANAGDSGISYKGTTLENCDLSSLYLTGDISTYTIDYTAIITCRSDEFEFTARTDFSQSSLAGKYNPVVSVDRSQKNRQSGAFNKTRDARGILLDAVTGLSSNDIATRIFSIAQAAANVSAYPVILSVQVDFPFCPASLGRAATCATSVPQFTLSRSFISFSNVTFQQYDPSQPPAPNNQPVITDATSNAVSNVIQSVAALVRLDLGNPSPNNFLLNTSAIPATLFATFPALPGVPDSPNQSQEYAVLTGAATDPAYNITGLLPLTVAGPAALDVVYLCRFQHAKAPAQAFVAVLVATLSMFGSGWAVFLGLATAVVKRRRANANTCSQHAREPTGEKQAFLVPG